MGVLRTPELTANIIPNTPPPGKNSLYAPAMQYMYAVNVNYINAFMHDENYILMHR